MKINIKNFGPIQNFETTLDSDLTLIVGKNNIGKSYAISLVYLILKNFSNRRFRNSFYLHEVLFKNSAKHEKKYNEKIIDLQNTLNKNGSVDIGDFFSEYVSDFLKNIVGEEIKNSMNGTFGDLSL
uniref:AAA family ATPase n=1 Tax=Acinetobacter junii TaxID=40215 RepID=UPI0012501A92